MNCEQFTQLINLYAVGELYKEENAQVENHLESCETCTIAVKKIQNLDFLVKTTLGSIPRSKSTIEKVSKNISSTADSAKLGTRSWTRLLIVSACLLFFVSVLVFTLSQSEPSATLLSGAVEIEGNYIRTKSQSGSVRLYNNSIIDLEPYTSLCVSRQNIEQGLHLVHLESGTATFAVPKLDFTVSTHHGNIKVLGTKFSVSFVNTSVLISVHSGSVEISNSHGKVTASLGESATLVRNAKPKLTDGDWEKIKDAPIDESPQEKNKSVALQKALNWLARHQNANGSWSIEGYIKICGAFKKSGPCDPAVGDSEYDIGATGLALLAFMGAGYHPDAKSKADGDGINYDKTVEKGIDFLVSKQKKDGRICSNTDHIMYNQLIGGLAIVEAYALTKKGSLKEPSIKVISYAVEAQNNIDGKLLGWRYTPNSGDNDSSVTGWAAMLLKAGQNAGIKVENKVFEGIANWYEYAVDKKTGIVGYDRRWNERYPLGSCISSINGKSAGFEIQPAVTAISLVALACEKNKQDVTQINKKSIEKLLEYLPAWKKEIDNKDMIAADFYYWLHGTLALHLILEKKSLDLAKWDKALAKAIIDSGKQNTKGCKEGSWDPEDRWACKCGRLGMTAMGALILEIINGSPRVLGHNLK